MPVAQDSDERRTGRRIDFGLGVLLNDGSEPWSAEAAAARNGKASVEHESCQTENR